MDTLLSPFLALILLYKYVAIFGFTFLGALALPIPSGATLLASFALASQGYLDPTLVTVAGLSGYIIGDCVGFFLARRYGTTILTKVGFGRLMKTRLFRRAETGIVTHPISTVFISRFATTVSPYVNVMAGISRMPFRTFALAVIVGESGEVALNYFGGSIFGETWEFLVNLFGISGLVFILILLLITAFTFRRWAIVRQEQP